MCGIAGIVKFNDTVSESEIIKMTDAIAHRGPDGEGKWISKNQNVGLGHRRLAIIDLSNTASQPMHSPCGNYTIVFNGEIYNYIELKEKLVKQGEIFYTDSDTEVLLRLYILNKELCLNDLDGMWSFAVWNEKEQSLFCARDRFGEKPFYFYKTEDAFYFGSEMKALWEIGVSKEVNQRAWNHYVNNNQLYDENFLHETFYKNIYQLKHSHYLYLNINRNFSVQQYYDIDWKKQSFKGTFEDAKVEFQRLFINSLKNRFRADVKVGTSLSGGLDSSSIVCNMTNFIGQDHVTPLTFSARFEKFEKDEGFFINKVIDKTRVTSHFTWPKKEDFDNDLQRLFFHQEEPFGSASIYAQYKVQELAKKHGVTVLIDGQGADEILAGYISYYPIYLQHYFSKSFLKFNHLRESADFVKYHTPHNPYLKAILLWSNFYFLKFKFNGFKNKYSGKITTSLSEELYNNTMKGGLQELLKYADRNSMAHGREIRLPFLNRELVEFCFSLPDEYKLKRGWTKYIMRCSFENVLPSEICWRREKVGFVAPQNEWVESQNNQNQIEAWQNKMYELLFCK